MGGAVSSGQNNDELVDNLCRESYITTPEVEKVFRQVDRADFMVFPDEQDALEAYEDHAWRRGKLHLSAPCIYTRAVEALKFNRGVSFLNVGSGTGYLSTMAGLFIGPYGINHGIEIYQENVDFAREKQAEFLEKFAWYDPLEFCEPLFVVGNGLLLSPGNLLYDRIYCGAACPPEHAQLMKNMLAVGGILVMPHDNQLESIHRVSQTEWKNDVVLPSVSFAPLILPSQESVNDLKALEIAVQPFSLKQCCRLHILQCLGRDRYCKVSSLPLPQHLKEYVSYYKEWGASAPPVQVLCPIDHSMDDNSSEEGAAARGGGGAGEEQGQQGVGSGRRGTANNNGARGRGGDADAGRPYFPHAQSMRVNGRRVLICNFNGLFFQIPIESDDNQSGSENEEGGAGEQDDNANADEDKEATSEEDAKSRENADENSRDSQDSMAGDLEVSMNSEMMSLEGSGGIISGDDVGMMEDEEEEGAESGSSLNKDGSCSKGAEDGGTVSKEGAGSEGIVREPE